ncbi:MAG: class I tRNA ligase family protein [Myxococcales bacterium]|nr:class I tRNA ligase family protein [Myxococcales bacterium]
MASFPKRFDFREAEPRVYQRWLDARCFEAAYDPEGRVRDRRRAAGRPFVMVIPPPNITGRLHMGHALNNTVQDVLVRYHRLDGDDALWIPGTDHAGIATQTVVKKQLDAEGLDYRSLGRDAMVERIWAWRQRYGDTILEQLRRMGCSCDWTRTRFTMDDGLSRAVRRAFVELHERGLIYRGKRIVNWCPIDRTALSDDEVERQDEKGKMWHLRYPLADDPSKHLVIATTRPETMFGDVAVAVHPDDDRFRHLVGKNVILPIVGRQIPVITDIHADPEKGSGRRQDHAGPRPQRLRGWVTPRATAAQCDERGRDAQRRGPAPLPRARSLRGAKAARGSTGRERARREDRRSRPRDRPELSVEGADRVPAVGPVVREDGAARGSGARSERLPSNRRGVGARAVRRGSLSSREVREDLSPLALEHPRLVHQPADLVGPPNPGLVPRRDQRDLGQRRDSDPRARRARIVEARRGRARHVVLGLAVAAEHPGLARAHARLRALLSDVSPLDGERHHLLLGGEDELRRPRIRRAPPLPRRLPPLDDRRHERRDDVEVQRERDRSLTLIEGASAEDLKRPVLEARPSNMKEMLQRIEKNFPDGFEAVGADAMRWTLIYCITEGEHVRLALDRFLEGRSFITKLWNGAGRVISAIEDEAERGGAREAPQRADRRGQLDPGPARPNHSGGPRGLDGFDFAKVAQALYRFVWDDYCSWALELSKTRLDHQDAATRRGALRVMGSVLADTLRLLHPIIPFVTEELWSRLTQAMTASDLWLDNVPASEILAVDVYPKPRRDPDPDIEARFSILQRFVSAIRQMRSGYRIKDSERIVVQAKALDAQTDPMLSQCRDAVRFLAKLDDIEMVDGRRPGMAAVFDPAFELYLDLSRYVDLSEEVTRLSKDLEKVSREAAGYATKLSNASFVDRAPPEMVEETRERLREAEDKKRKLEETLQELEALVSAQA